MCPELCRRHEEGGNDRMDHERIAADKAVNNLITKMAKQIEKEMDTEKYAPGEIQSMTQALAELVRARNCQP